MLAIFGVAWVFPNSVRNPLLQWKVKGLQKKNKAVCRLALICLFWCIWEERNRRTFKDEEFFNQSLKDFFSQTLFEWFRDSLELDFPSILNFLDTLFCG